MTFRATTDSAITTNLKHIAKMQTCQQYANNICKSYKTLAKEAQIVQSRLRVGPGPYTGFNDGRGAKAEFPTTGGGQGPQILKFPQNHNGPPLCANRDLRFREGAMAPLPPLYTGLVLDEDKTLVGYFFKCR